MGLRYLSPIIIFALLAPQSFAAPEALFLSQLQQHGSCCAVLSRALPGKVFKQNSTTYSTSQESFYTQQEQSVNPACIVLPTESKDVSTAVAVVAAADILQSSAKDCKLAVRSGGHTPWAGAANIANGITIDLQPLNSVEVSADRTKAGIGAGNRWENIYPKLDAQNLAMVGGRVSTVGAGGLITGGGISFFSPRYGFACDNVINYELVTATGAILNVNQKSYPKLYRALKGGSNNFGIVTRFDVSVFEQGDIWGGFVIPPLANRDQQFAFFANFTRSATYDPFASLISTYGFGEGVFTGEPVMPIMHLMYTKPTAFPSVYKPITDAPQIVNTLRTAPLSNHTDEFVAGDPVTPTRGRYSFQTLTFVNSEAYMRAMYDLTFEWRQKVVNVTGLSGALNFQPYPALTRSYAAARGGNVLGLEGDDDLVNGQVAVAWVRKEDDELMYSSLEELFGKLNERAKEMGVFHPYIYLNYAAQWQKPIQGYGKENVEFMREVSGKYDPRGLFQKRLPGGFKLEG